MKQPPLKKYKVNNYEYCVTSADLKLEQEAFEAGEGVSYNTIATVIFTTALYFLRKRS